jgi:hypothetical protein
MACWCSLYSLYLSRSKFYLSLLLRSTGACPLLVSFLSNVPSRIVEDIIYPRLELENISYPLYAPIDLNLVATLS